MEQIYFDSIVKGICLSLCEVLMDLFFKLRLDKYQSFQDLNGKHFIGFDFKDRSIKNENKSVYQQIFHTFVKEIYEIK